MNANTLKILHKTALKLTVLLSITCWVLPTQAAVIAQYDFAGQTLTSKDTDPNSTAENFAIEFAAGASTTGTLGGTIFAFSDDVYGDPVTPGDEAGAIAFGNYFSFTVAPVVGYQIDLTSMSFDILFDTSPGTSQGTWFVKSSVGGFESGDPTVGSRNAPVSTTDTDIATIDPLIDLSGLPTLTSSTEFRLYIYDNLNSTGAPHRLDNVILNGDAALIPEPSTLWMVALGLAAVVAIRRRR